MKIIVFILLNFLLLFSASEKSNVQKTFKTNSKDAVMAQEVQSFYSANPSSQTRNKVQFWEEGSFVPKLK
ncbi:hypothetical protein D9V86_07455 [Bacteroidetes/Chlorobi group bacterium ChocPot_Mid]|jgi:hypothetical protein|nr:MAG: hypothetical protein D9V86_07455 [Bacteroidetes/Chlorobi group bacterium ChocPot_Mid]